jgi:hypothetical protein
MLESPLGNSARLSSPSASTVPAGNNSARVADSDTDIENTTPSGLAGAASEMYSNKTWRTLMQNVDKAVEELYDYCDIEGNEFMCQEAFNMMYKNTRDLWNLMDRMIQQRDFNSHTKSSVSWEIRKPTSGSGNYSAAPTVGYLYVCYFLKIYVDLSVSMMHSLRAWAVQAFQLSPPNPQRRPKLLLSRLSFALPLVLLYRNFRAM